MWIDAVGTAHPAAGSRARIVSLVPSVTELLFALGLGPQVAGRTAFCIHPRDGVRDVPVVGGTKNVDADKVRAVRPTHVIANIDENRGETVLALSEFVPHMVVTHPNAPVDAAGLFRLIGGIFGRAAEAGALVASLERELEACRARDWPPERVLYLVWKDPWMTVASDTYIARTLACVGWQVPHGPGGERGAARYPVVSDLDAEVARVDRVLLPSEPFRFREAHARDVRARYVGKAVSLIDGEMTSWYGPRAIAGLAYLRETRSTLLGAAGG